MEVETICRYNLPVTVVVLNNGGIYRGDFKNLGTDGDPSPLTLSACAHYEKLMEAFGGTGYYATASPPWCAASFPSTPARSRATSPT